MSFPKNDRLVAAYCQYCHQPMLVRPRNIRYGKGKYHRRCAQVVRALGEKNGNHRSKRAVNAPSACPAP